MIDAAERGWTGRDFRGSAPRHSSCGNKPMVGHCIGGSGAAETVASLLAFRDGVIPLTLVTTQVDQPLADCTVKRCVQQSHPQVFLSLTASVGVVLGYRAQVT